MPLLRVAEAQIELPRNIALVDTNVLVAYFDKRDNNHEQAVLVLDELLEYIWVVSYPVVIETCGMLGSRTGADGVLECLQWLVTPGNASLLPGSHPTSGPEQMMWMHIDWMSKFRVDYVDASLMELANSITLQFDLRPHLPIVTFDTRDFLRCASNGLSYSLYDMRSLDFIDFRVL